MVSSEQVPTPSLRKLPDPGGPLMRISIIGAKPPVHRCSPFPQIVIVLCPLFLQVSSGTAIAILGACRAHRLARWHRFVSIERSEPLQPALQGTFARAMIRRKTPNLPRTAVSALFHAFLQFIWHGNRHSTGLQGTFARAMVCKKLAV